MVDQLEFNGTREALLYLIGEVPADKNSFKHKMRLHQGWWRTAVLCEDPGKNPATGEGEVCNMMEDGKATRKNFLSEAAYIAAQRTLEERQQELARYGKAAGIVDEDRLHNNLLSSQPLAFNFYGELKLDLDFATEMIRIWEPDIDRVISVEFEYAPLPKKKYTDDNSAFDVAFFFESQGLKGLLGLECKYTDTFSAKEYDSPAYNNVFERSQATFKRPYKEYIASRYNQLFRNQLIAESLRQHGEVDIVRTGLFCHQDDESALGIAGEFREMLENGGEGFRIITYMDYISNLQRMALSVPQREWTMMLWARYTGLTLSQATFQS